MVQNWLNNTETNKKKGITEGSGKPPELPNYWVMGLCEKYSYTVAEVLLCGRCFQAKFCSRKCQKEHWPEQQEDCRLNPDPIPLPVQLRWSQGSDFLLHTVSDTGVHGGAARQDSVGIQVLPDINIALHDGVVGGFMDTAGFHTQE